MLTQFTPLQSLAGGALIGVAAVLLMATNGRIAGITGVLGGLLPPGMAKDWPWRAAFIAGLVASPLLYLLLAAAPLHLLPQPIAFQPIAAPLATLVAGVVVGVGVSFSSGCTSGHGVCGLARLSPRSLAAVVTFMATTAATVFVVRHVIGG